MIICRECGFRNADADAFCGTCGGFLEFTGEKTVPQVSEEFRQQAEREAAAPPVKVSLIDRIERSFMTMMAPPPAEVARQEPEEEKPEEEQKGEKKQDEGAASGGPPPEAANCVAGPAGDLVAPVEKPPGGQPPDEAGKPPERAPQATRKLAAAVTKTKPTHRLRPGDLICGQCGEGNPPVRKFCSRCGSSLLEAERVKTPWWRRLLRVFRRGPRVVALTAGDAAARKALTGHDPRFALRKLYRRARLVLAGLIGAGVILYGSYAPFRYQIDNRVDSARARARVTGAIDIHYVPVHAVAVSANLQDKANPAYDAVDAYLSTYWLAPYSAADYPTLTLTFGSPVTLGRIIIYSGASGDYLAHGRPSLLVLVFSNDTSATLVPQDTPKEQIMKIGNAVQVNSVKIELEGTYPGTGRPDVAISDIELFKLE